MRRFLAVAVVGALLGAGLAFAQNKGDQPLPGKGRLWSEDQTTTRTMKADAGQVGISLINTTGCRPYICADIPTDGGTATLYSGSSILWEQDPMTGNWGPDHAGTITIANECIGAQCCFGQDIPTWYRAGRMLLQNNIIQVDGGNASGNIATALIQCTVAP